MSQTDDVLDALFEGIDSNPSKPSKPTTTSNTPSNPHSSSNPTNTSTTAAPNSKSEKDILAELDLLTADRHPPSRPSTPRVRKSFEGRRPLEGGRSSGEYARTAGGYGIGTGITRRDSSDVGTGASKLSTPLDSQPPPTVAVTNPQGTTTSSTASTGGGGGGGGWWGGIWSTATTAIKTAEGVYHEIQQQQQQQQQQQHNIRSEQRPNESSPEGPSSPPRNPTAAAAATASWLTQNLKNVNLSTIQSLTTSIQSRALPTLSTIINTIAPPISAHEQLRIHITHDIQGYPIFDTIVYGVFERVMQQVEGGDLLVVQRGGEAKVKSSFEGGWKQGPWYRDVGERRLNALIVTAEGSGAEEGVKLAKAAAEAYAAEYKQYKLQHHEDEKAYNPDNPTRKSEIFLGIQPVTFPSPTYLRKQKISEKDLQQEDDDDDDNDSEDDDTLTSFALYLLDPQHHITYATLSQAIPAKWLGWLESDSQHLFSGAGSREEGLVGWDPREWVVEWLEEAVGLAVGIVAQRYVAKRMNVGVGRRLDKGKGREMEEVVLSGVGEEARAI